MASQKELGKTLRKFLRARVCPKRWHDPAVLQFSTGGEFAKASIRLHSLDALRGIAALAVVLWHWQHFQLLGTPSLTWPDDASALDHSHEPLPLALNLFYAHGYVGVDLFFLISGFIFFWLYADKLENRSLSVTEFWLLRLTRLYPLHIVTLLLVAGLQLAFRRQTGQYFVYRANDLPHFLKSLLVFQVNGDGAAFNGPAWSITIEFVMYGLFCVVAWLGLFKYLTVPFTIVCVGFLLYARHQNIARGLCGFFGGGLIYYLFVAIRQSIFRRQIFLATAVACLIGWLAILINNYAPLLSASKSVKTFLPISGTLPELGAIYIVFPLTILSLSMHEEIATSKYEYLSWLGKISYSSYLLHFPLQIVFALALTSSYVPLRTRGSGIFLLIYFSVLIGMSLGVFRGFEAPVQRRLRLAWRGRSGLSLRHVRTTMD